LTPEQVRAQFGGALQQSSLEIYAPLEDASCGQGEPLENRAQSFSTVFVNGNNVTSQEVVPVSADASRVKLNFFAVPNRAYEIQRSTSADFATYEVVRTGTSAPANGLISFCDINPPSPAGFYRLRQQ